MKPSAYLVLVVCVAVARDAAADRSPEDVIDEDNSFSSRALPPTADRDSSYDPVRSHLYASNRDSKDNQHSHGSSASSAREGESEESRHPERYHVATVDFPHVSGPFVISLWIVIAGFAKIGFFVTPKISHVCPESCVLLLVGVLIGLVLYFTELSTVGPLTPDVFFLYMLPPIVLDAGYFMPNRLFFDNLTSILMYAVIGTVFNAVCIGLSLWGIGLTGLFGIDLPLLHVLLFSSIVSAVDPVAVLAVFEEIHVNEILYIIVFGESLLNDAVTVVLYHVFEGLSTMGPENIIAVDYVAGVASFFVVALGGTLVGIIWGVIAAFVSRFTHHVRIIEPLFVFVLAYLSYLTAELFHLSGIMALTFCGITMKNYVEENISHKSHVTVKYAMKMLANSSETIIFVLLGVSTVNDRHEWNTWFIILTIIFCTVYRALGVIILTAIANRFRLHRFNKVEQFIMSYGGLRGAVAFALVLVISEKTIPAKNTFVTAIICVVYFTVFLQGMTIGHLVNFLEVEKSYKSKPSMNQRFHLTLIDHLMAGIETVSDHLMGNYKVRDKFKHYNNRFIRPILTRNHKIREPKILQTYSKLHLEDAMNQANSSPVSQGYANDLGVSLSTLLRNYTQTNLASEQEEKEEKPPTIPINDAPFLNVDMGELEYNPSYKDLADAEIHHILEDNMFKPPRRQRRYSRTELVDDNDTTHPPFHHHMRLQIRRLMSENTRRRNRRIHSNQSSPPRHHMNGDISTIYMNNRENYQRGGRHFSLQVESMPFTIPGVTKKDEEDDEGITFVARSRSASTPNNDLPKGDLPPSARTVTEMSLPWKREEDCSDGKCVRRQQEFPAWVENKDYFSGYLSPTNTFLESLSSSKLPTGKRTPAIFEIFDQIGAIEEANDENAEDSLSGESDHQTQSGGKEEEEEKTFQKARQLQFAKRSSSSDSKGSGRTDASTGPLRIEEATEEEEGKEPHDASKRSSGDPSASHGSVQETERSSADKGPQEVSIDIDITSKTKL